MLDAGNIWPKKILRRYGVGLYPAAFTSTSDSINTIWNSTSPKWIEGFITKEEAELSLQGPRGLQEPGTFVLRFPTSRSWPHPDAGSLIVTYVGSDYTVHHRLLSLDYIYRFGLPFFLLSSFVPLFIRCEIIEYIYQFDY